ncbi:MAG: MerR family transcriptional regulator [Stenotrophomonas acidaminiphila]|jgi:DNA-binding transcriptional MerR regulator|nr:MAG: MerR family transcriptional regulator [Stenotrophomonas acidaminiphila]
MSTALKIGRLAQITGTNAPTIRYYEQIGLLPAPTRPAGSQRVYDENDVRRLTFIRRCRDFDFPIEKVRQMVVLMDSERSCMEARDLAQEQLEEVRRKLQELRQLEQSIAGFVERCDQQCAGGAGADCVIIEELSLRTLGSPATTGCCGPAK